MKVNVIEFQRLCGAYMGYCTECDEFTREMTEPDAEDYDCPVCDGDTVMGAENALIYEKIQIGNEG